MEALMRPAPDTWTTPTHPAAFGAASALTPEDVSMIRAANARYFVEERARDARRLAAYHRECLASWGDSK